jgi:hypothetical protein
VAALCAGKGPLVLSEQGGWLGPMTILNAVEKRKFPCPLPGIPQCNQLSLYSSDCSILTVLHPLLYIVRI